MNRYPCRGTVSMNRGLRIVPSAERSWVMQEFRLASKSTK
jgi:hypothetical protein